MSTHGIRTLFVDPTTHCVIDGAWLERIRLLGVTHISVKLTCAADGTFPTKLYQTAFDRATSYGLTVLAITDMDFTPLTRSYYPNMSLNVSGDKLSSPYIDDWTMRLAACVRQLVPHGCTRVAIWNEPNQLGNIPAGEQPPAGPKADCLNPEVAGALCWQAGLRLRSVGVREVFIGALSVLPLLTGLDSRNEYYTRYLRRMLGVVRNYIGSAPFPYAGLLLNAEGIWDAPGYAKAVADVRAVLDAYIPATSTRPRQAIITGEYGITNEDSRRGQLAASAAVVQANSDEDYYFCHHGDVPYAGDPALYTDYGIERWLQQGNTFTPAGEYPLYETVVPLLAAGA